jgi:RNA polymerase sigma factor (sigma-70 family)
MAESCLFQGEHIGTEVVESPAAACALSQHDRDSLAVTFQPLAYKLANNYRAQLGRQGLAMDVDDLRSEALLALVEASRKFDPTKSKFITYAQGFITTRLTAITDTTRIAKSIGGEFEQTSRDYSNDEDPETFALSADEEEMMSRVPPTCRDAVRLCLLGRTPDQVAIQLGVTEKSVRMMLANAGQSVTAKLKNDKRFAGGIFG